jgi:hypothetical protein
MNVVERTYAKKKSEHREKESSGTLALLAGG